jgi:predicted NodU family carbamoyl transferase
MGGRKRVATASTISSAAITLWLGSGIIGAVLNTSVNLHGAPIVGSPVTGLDVFERSELRWLAIGNFLVQKESDPPA